MVKMARTCVKDRENGSSSRSPLENAGRVDNSQFSINGGNATFSNKQKLLDSVLSNAELNVNLSPSNELIEVDDSRSSRSKRKETKVFRGQESLFKVPNSPPPRRRYEMPDFKRNPHKWTRYSLADVPASDMTESSNTAAALTFLRSIRKSPDPISENSLKFTSKAARVPQTNTVDLMEIDPCENEPKGKSNEAISDKTTIVNGKIVMPEYVVGEKVKKNRIRKEKPILGKEVNLSHLHDDEVE